MSYDDIFSDLQKLFSKSHEQLQHEFKRIRTGRASPTMIEHVQVEAYGAFSPVSQVASVSVPEPAQLLIKPFDKTLLKAIEKALTTADLGMQPTNDGAVIRLNIPPLSTERRKSLANDAKEAAEKCKIALRNVRRDAIKAIESRTKEQRLPEDGGKQAQTKVQDLLKAAEAKTDSELKSKQEDIMRL